MHCAHLHSPIAPQKIQTNTSPLPQSVGPSPQWFVQFPRLLPLANQLVLVSLGSQVMPSQITNPGDAEEKRYSCHRVDRVTLDSAHHCLAPKRHSAAPRHPQGYALHRTAQCCTPPPALHSQYPDLKWVLEPGRCTPGTKKKGGNRSFRGAR